MKKIYNIVKVPFNGTWHVYDDNPLNAVIFMGATFEQCVEYLSNTLGYLVIVPVQLLVINRDTNTSLSS